jgi:signal transduction histidine kinase
LTARGAARATLVLDVALGVLWATGLLLFAANRSVFDGNALVLFFLFGLTAGAYAVAGTMIARRQPSNAISWVCFAIGGLLIAGLSMTEYGVHALVVAPDSLPVPNLVLALAAPTPLLSIAGMVLLLYLFPTGRPSGFRWRLAAWTTTAAALLGSIAALVTRRLVTDIWSDRLSRIGLSVPNPLGIGALEGIGGALQAGFGWMFAVGSLLGVASLFARRRRADLETRAQLKWLALIAGTAAAWVVVMLPLGLAAGGEDSIVANIFWLVATPLVAFGIPIAIGIAILRYRLFDIDVVISKTVVIGAFAAFITAVYLVVVVGIGGLVGSGSNTLLSVIATAIVALAFQPIRTRARRLADRIVYGARATPYEVLSEFSQRVAGSYATEDVLPRMAQILGQGTGALRAEVWLRVGSELRTAAAWPDSGLTRALPVRREALPAFEDVTRGVAVLDRDELLGALTIAKPPAEPLTPTEEKLLDDLASQAGLVLRNVRLIQELKGSRQRLVAAQDEERRRIERNLHDGAQQQLVSLAVKLGLLERAIGSNDERARDIAAELRTDASGALEDLRDLARGIYPPLLADKGLGAALQAQARKVSVPVDVTTNGIGRYSPDVEAAVYFCCLEALNNISKYARAQHVRVDLRGTPEEVTFEVVDDGDGFDPTTIGYGTGLQGMADRLEAMGGRLEVTSALGAGTTITGRVGVAEGIMN